MIYRKGELSPAADRGCSYQVALPADHAMGGNYDIVHCFCRDLSLCSRGHSVQRDGVRYVVFCFSNPEHAELFRARLRAFSTDASCCPARDPWGQRVRRSSGNEQTK
jgi:hypothetical protein